MRKVLHVVLSLDIGGLEKVLVNCINQLNDDSYTHEIIALKGYSESFKSLLPKDISVTSFEKKEGNDFSVYKKFLRYLQNSKPDVVHTYNLSTLEFQVIAFFCRVKNRIHAEHGRDIFDPDGKNKKYILLRKLVFPLVNQIVAVSNDLYQWLQKDINVSQNKVSLIVNGIDTSLFIPRKVEQNSEAFVFGHVGRLAEIKNQQLMVEAFSIACKINPAFENRAKLMVVGDGDCREGLIERIENLQLSNSISLLGSKFDMLHEYHKFDAFVMSSLAEGIPMTLLESMSCGIVPVVTSVGGIPEVVSNENGFLYESKDAEALAHIMLRLVDKPAVAKQLGAAARQTILERFSESAMVNAYASLYQGAANG